MAIDAENNRLLREVVDFVVPVLPPYETSLYLILLRLSYLETGVSTVQIGYRKIGEFLGKGTRSSGGNQRHIRERLQSLAKAGFIEIGDTDRLGTRYVVMLPTEVPVVRERIATTRMVDAAPLDYYNDPTLREEMFERDNWKCRYCGIGVTAETAALDHIIPISKGGQGTAENLATCCMMCNSIKSGRSYDEAAPQIRARLAALRSQDSN